MSHIRKIYICSSISFILTGQVATAQNFPSSSQIREIRRNSFPNATQEFQRTLEREKMERQLDNKGLFRKFRDLDNDMKHFKSRDEVYEDTM